MLGTPDLDLELYDDTQMTPHELKLRALEVEKAALSVTGVMQAEGANAHWATSAFYFMTSHGFSAGWRSSRHGMSVSAIAEKDGAMERDYDVDGSRWLADLKTAEEIGRLAGERTIARLGSRPNSVRRYGLLSSINGFPARSSLHCSAPSPARRLRAAFPFLKDKMGETLFTPDIQIIDDPFMVRGHGFAPLGRRRRYHRKTQPYSRRQVDDMATQYRLGQTIRPNNNRSCRARYRLPARCLGDQYISRGGDENAG